MKRISAVLALFAIVGMAFAAGCGEQTPEGGASPAAAPEAGKMEGGAPPAGAPAAGAPAGAPAAAPPGPATAK
jgi:hypothetical protein